MRRTLVLIIIFTVISGIHICDVAKAVEGTDSTPPTIDVNPTSGTLSPGDKITIQAVDESGIHHIGYAWNGGDTTVVYDTKVEITVPDSLNGTNKLYVYAKDAAIPSANSTDWVFYTYNIGAKSDSAADHVPPKLIVNPTSGNLKPGDIITVEAQDSSGILHIGYVWNSGETTTAVFDSKAEIKIPDDFNGINKLYIYAKDNSSNYNSTGWKYYTYRVGSNLTIFIEIIIIILIISIIYLISTNITGNVGTQAPPKPGKTSK